MSRRKFISKAFVITAVVMLVLSSVLLTLVSFPSTPRDITTSTGTTTTGTNTGTLPNVMSGDIGIITGA